MARFARIYCAKAVRRDWRVRGERRHGARPQFGLVWSQEFAPFRVRCPECGRVVPVARLFAKGSRAHMREVETLPLS